MYAPTTARRMVETFVFISQRVLFELQIVFYANQDWRNTLYMYERSSQYDNNLRGVLIFQENISTQKNGNLLASF